jgi:hypothetical protein
MCDLSFYCFLPASKYFQYSLAFETPNFSSSVDFSCYVYLLTMLLQHTPLGKNSWTSVHELLHHISMLLDIKFTLLTCIFYWISLPPDQILKIGLPLGLLANPLINDLFHRWFFCYRNLFLSLNLLLIC